MFASHWQPENYSEPLKKKDSFTMLIEGSFLIAQKLTAPQGVGATHDTRTKKK
jgi:hypothetical protein